MKSKIEELVERFEPGTVFTVEEFRRVLRALQPYAEGDPFISGNLAWASSLDQNEVIVRLDENDYGEIYPVATSGVIFPTDSPI